MNGKIWDELENEYDAECKPADTNHYAVEFGYDVSNLIPVLFLNFSFVIFCA